MNDEQISDKIKRISRRTTILSKVMLVTAFLMILFVIPLALSLHRSIDYIFLILLFFFVGEVLILLFYIVAPMIRIYKEAY